MYSGCNVPGIDASKGVGSSSVAADGEELGVYGSSGEKVGHEEWGGVFVAYGAFVEVVRDAFHAWVMDERPSNAVVMPKNDLRTDG